MPKDNLVPLPLDPTGQSSPLNTVGRLPDAGSKDPLDEGLSPTEQWLQDHPSGFDENAPVKPVVPPTPLDTEDDSVGEQTPSDETPAPEVKAADTETAPAPEVKAAETKDAPAVVAEAPVVEQPLTKAPTFAPEDKIALAEGVEWTRGQVIAALEERVALQPKAAEVEQFQKIFRMDAAKAAEVWAPVVDRIVADPGIATFVDGYLSDAEKRAYLDQCATYYDESVPKQAPQVQQPTVDPVVRKQMQDLLEWKSQREQRDAKERYDHEVESVRARYPFVVNDPALFNDLRETARYMWQQDNNKGLLDALAIKSSLYDALAIARASQDAQQQSPAPQVPVVPVLSSNGAAPGATRRTSNRQRSFKDLDEATAAWLAEHPDGNYEG